MGHSPGREAAQALIDANIKYTGSGLTLEQVGRAINSTLPPENQYTPRGLKHLAGWLTGLKPGKPSTGD
jgi:hypothetical protein